MSGAPTTVPTMELAECERLRECELTIDRGLRNFVDVGTALLEIQEHRLYRGTHATFAAYIKERWGMSGRRGYQMMESAKVVGLLPVSAGQKPPIEVGENVNHGSQTEHETPAATVPAPESERSVRPLTKLPKEKVAPVYKRAVEKAKGKAPSARQVEEAVKEEEGGEEPEAVAPEAQELPMEDDSASVAMAAAKAAMEILGEIPANDRHRIAAIRTVVEWCRIELKGAK